MDKWNKVWIVEYYDDCDGWTSRGFFTTKEKAEKYLEDLKKYDDDIYDETSEFRIDWNYLDKGYHE